MPGVRCLPAAPATAARCAGCSGSSAPWPARAMSWHPTCRPSAIAPCRLDSNLVRSYIELVESAAPQTQEHEVLIAVQIDQRRGGRELRRLGGGDRGACELLLREAESLAERLAVAEVSVFGLLRPRRYAELIRDAFDPYGAQGRARAALGDPSREGVDPALLGPLADQESWSSVSQRLRLSRHLLDRGLAAQRCGAGLPGAAFDADARRCAASR